LEFSGRLVPAVTELRDVIWSKAQQWVDVVKIGRTHLQDATPLTVGQEWSGYATQLTSALESIRQSLQGLYQLAIGGTAVGTGVNAPPDFGEKSTAEIAKLTGHPFVPAPNKFAAMGGQGAMVAASAALRSLAVALMKIANDLRWVGSGPRAGIRELILPSNEPGSSIMPGKVNPTQEEAVMMVCIQVIGEDNAVTLAGSQGNFELNTMCPIIIKNVLHSARVLGDACIKFRKYGIEGIELDRARIDKYVSESLMLVTALSPAVGYDRAAAIAHRALSENITLRHAALKEGVSAEDFDRLVNPKKMVGNPRRDLRLD